jgi:hypothetical protein
MEGVEGIRFTPMRNQRVFDAKKVQIPVTEFSKNVYSTATSVTIDEQMENLNVERTSSVSGIFKSQGTCGLYLFDYDYMKEDAKKYDPKYKENSRETGNKSRNAEEKRKKDAAREDKTKSYMDQLKENIEDDFDVVSYDDYEVLNAGRYDEDPVLKFKETFKIKSLVNKAGKNYIFEIGKLIGKQFELNEENMKRSSDIYLPFTKTITNEITVTLPAGYKAEGLADLSFNTDNELAGFSSSAKQEGNKIIVTTKKLYKKNFDKKENWPKMTEVLDVAYKFTQKKVILKKS